MGKCLCTNRRCRSEYPKRYLAALVFYQKNDDGCLQGQVCYFHHAEIQVMGHSGRGLEMVEIRDGEVPDEVADQDDNLGFQIDNVGYFLPTQLVHQVRHCAHLNEIPRDSKKIYHSQFISFQIITQL